jgi:hypothetical protein
MDLSVIRMEDVLAIVNILMGIAVFYFNFTAVPNGCPRWIYILKAIVGALWSVTFIISFWISLPTIAIYTRSLITLTLGTLLSYTLMTRTRHVHC